MNNQPILKSIAVICIAAAILCAGIMIPFELLKVHKDSAFNNFTLLSSGEGALADKALSYNELVERISQWDSAQYNGTQAQISDQSPRNGLTAKEPSGDELTMLEAQVKGLEELQLLMNMGLMPKFDLGDFSITGATLYAVTNNPGISRWELYFSNHNMVDSEGTDMVLSIDSVQGCVYSFSLKPPENFEKGLTLTQLCEDFALYHNIEQTAAVTEGRIQTKDGLLVIQAKIDNGEYSLRISSEKYSQ